MSAVLREPVGGRSASSRARQPLSLAPWLRSTIALTIATLLKVVSVLGQRSVTATLSGWSRSGHGVTMPPFTFNVSPET
jgi:hypothetical protein